LRLHRWLLLLLVGFGFAASERGWAAPPDPQASTAKKGAPRAAASKKPAARRATATRRRTPAASRRWRPAQHQPARERYAEIQTALIGKGFLEEPATGTWDEKSVEALKRFQESNNLEPTGRINSLSLIALGLGPNHGAVGAALPEATE
jgi:peptidoglycan hydrolase-like protein with peptidoglycan-binding domain